MKELKFEDKKRKPIGISFSNNANRNHLQKPIISPDPKPPRKCFKQKKWQRKP